MTETLQQAARRLAAGAIRKGFVPQALHIYTDEEGRPLHWRIRLKHPASGEKWIRPMRLKDGRYMLGELEYPKGKPLYRLHELAARPADPVIVVEGEWCADALAKAGVLVTTSGAADSARKADWSILAGHTVTIWPDNDEAGRRYAWEVEEILRALDCMVHVIDVDALNLPPKGDAVDWLAAHPEATAADILALPLQTIPDVAEMAQAKTGTSPPAPPGEEPDEQVIAHLAALPPLAYDRERRAAAEALGVRPATLDRMVAAARREEADAGIGFDEPDPWPTPIDPAALLSEIAAMVCRFIVCQAETAHAVALWAAMTWLIDVVQIAPLAVITAPEKRCGKSQLLFLLGRLVCRPLTASNISPAALFRCIDAWRPTLLVDEADAFMRENEELRGLLNCGHTRDSAYIVRVVGEDHTPRRFNVWGAKAIAGIGQLADTLMDRAVTLELRRKLPHEEVERLRHAEPGLFDDLAAKLARFAEDSREAVRAARPALPSSLNDRAQDNWEPLLAIAEVAGGAWPEWARAAALKLSGADSPTMSVGTELLADIQEVFEQKRVERISTVELIETLCADEERPWATYNRGHCITPRQVSTRLKEYGIRSKTIRLGYGTPKGYERAQFEEAFSRYLSSPTPPDNTRHTPQPSNGAAFGVADRGAVAATPPPSATREAAWHKGCGGVADAWEGARTNTHGLNTNGERF